MSEDKSRETNHRKV